MAERTPTRSRQDLLTLIQKAADSATPDRSGADAPKGPKHSQPAKEPEEQPTDDVVEVDESEIFARAEDALEREVARHERIAEAMRNQPPTDRAEALRREAVAARAAAAAAATAAAATAAREVAAALQDDDDAGDHDLRAMATEVDLANATADTHATAAAAARAEAEVAARRQAAAAASAPAQDGRDLVAHCKALGNAMLVDAEKAPTAADRQDFLERAEQAYGRALDADPAREHASAAILLANRAQARLKLAMTYGVWSAPDKYREAIDDASEALELKPGYVKASYRRARARLALACAPHAEAGSAQQATMLGATLADLRAVLRAEPKNVEAKRWLEAAPRLSAEFAGKRLPDALSELAREMTRLGGTVASATAHPRANSRIPRLGRTLCSLWLLGIGIVVLHIASASRFPADGEQPTAATPRLRWDSMVNMTWADVEEAASIASGRAANLTWTDVVESSGGAVLALSSFAHSVQCSLRAASVAFLVSWREKFALLRGVTVEAEAALAMEEAGVAAEADGTSPPAEEAATAAGAPAPPTAANLSGYDQLVGLATTVWSEAWHGFLYSPWSENVSATS